MEEIRFVIFDVTVEDYVEGQQNKSTKEKTARRKITWCTRKWSLTRGGRLWEQSMK